MLLNSECSLPFMNCKIYLCVLCIYIVLYIHEIKTRNEQPATLTQEEFESREVLNISLNKFCRRMSLYLSYFFIRLYPLI